MRRWLFVALTIAGLASACVPLTPEPEPSPPTILTSELPAGVAGFFYSWGLEASGGSTPYSWSAEQLPEGLSVTPDGFVKGFPESTGTHEIVLTVIDARGSSASAQLELMVPEAAPEQCRGQSCEIATPDSAVEVPGGAVADVERDGDGVVVAVTVVGTPPPLGSVAVFGWGEHLPSGLVAVVTGTSPAAQGTRLDVEMSDPGTAYSDLVVQALPPEEPTTTARSVLAASSYRCSGGVTLNGGSTEFRQTLRPYLSATSRRAWLGSGDIWLGTGGLSTFSAGIEGTIELRLNFGVSGRANCSLNLPAARVLVPTGPGGGVIFTLNPRLELTASGAASVETAVRLNCTTHYGWTAQSGDSSGSWCRPAHEPMRVNASNGVEASLGVSMGARVTWNDIAGITGDIGASVTASYQPGRNPQGVLSARSDWNIGACLACFWKGSPLNATFASGTIFDKVLGTWGQVPGGPPEPPVSTTSPSTTSTTTPESTAVQVSMASVSSSGEHADDFSSYPSVSASGRQVAFVSSASNLVPNDTNNVADVFVHDTISGETTRVSVASDGTEANYGSVIAAISGDGRFVTFSSEATNLSPGDTNGADVFVHDRVTRTTSVVSVTSAGFAVEGHSVAGGLSSDGRYVVFDSYARLDPGDTNHTQDVYVHDRVTGNTSRVSVAADGAAANGSSRKSVISADGRHIAFVSDASNLVSDKTNYLYDVFVHDRVTGTTSRVSVASDGTEANGLSMYSGLDQAPSISADGRYIAFGSLASNLVPGDTNNANDVFVHDRVARTTSRVSLTGAGAQVSRGSGGATISGDGRLVSYISDAPNLVTGDTNNAADVFVHDRQTGAVSRASMTSVGTQANAASYPAVISSNGQFIGYISSATNLVPGGTDGRWHTFVAERGS